MLQTARHRLAKAGTKLVLHHMPCRTVESLRRVLCNVIRLMNRHLCIVIGESPAPPSHLHGNSGVRFERKEVHSRPAVMQHVSANIGLQEVKSQWLWRPERPDVLHDKRDNADKCPPFVKIELKFLRHYRTQHRQRDGPMHKKQRPPPLIPNRRLVRPTSRTEAIDLHARPPFLCPSAEALRAFTQGA